MYTSEGFQPLALDRSSISGMEGDLRSPQFDESTACEAPKNRFEAGEEKLFEISVVDIAGRDQEELPRFPAKNEAVDKVGILRDYDALFPKRHLVEVRVRGSVA